MYICKIWRWQGKYFLGGEMRRGRGQSRRGLAGFAGTSAAPGSGRWPTFPHRGSARLAVGRCAARSRCALSSRNSRQFLRGRKYRGCRGVFLLFSILNPAVSLFWPSLELLEDCLILKNGKQRIPAFSGHLLSCFISPYHLI